MMRYLRIAGVLLLTTGCYTVQDNITSFIEEGIRPFNDRIAQAASKGESWVESPESIVRALFTSADVTTDLVVVDSTRRSDNAVIVFTEEGFKDDSIEGEKRIIEMRRVDQVWRIERIRLGFKCKQGRGKQYYTGEYCR